MRPIGSWVAPKRFIAFVVVLVVATFLAWQSFPLSQAFLIGFDIGAVIFLLSIWSLLGACGPDEMRRRARANDANRRGLLVITSLVVVAILVAIWTEVSAKGGVPHKAALLIIATLAIAWLFSNMIYALHYAHLFYSEGAAAGDKGGLEMPGDGEPDYWDFIYFAFTLGMTFQTSDVTISGRHMRQVAIFHCFAAFVFNIGVLAFTINVLGGG